MPDNQDLSRPRNSAEAMFWGDPPQAAAPQRPDYVPSFVIREEERWRWRYSWFLGVMYGPIPVGAIVVFLLMLVR